MVSDDELLRACVRGFGEQLPSMKFVLLDLRHGAATIDDCRTARRAGSVVVAVCDGDDELAAVDAFDAGADDVICPPVRPNELLARLRAHARHHELRSNLLHLDFDAHTVTVAGRLVEVSTLEFNLLVVLTSEPGRDHSRSELRARCWDAHSAVGPRVIDGVVATLRRKLGPSAGLIETVRGYGYRFIGGATSSQRTSSRPISSRTTSNL